MTRDRMTEMLSEAICVTREEARTALEAREWKVLDAARLLEQERARAKKAEAAEACRRDGGRKIGSAIRDLFFRADRNRFDSRPADPAVL